MLKLNFITLYSLQCETPRTDTTRANKMNTVARLSDAVSRLIYVLDGKFKGESRNNKTVTLGMPSA